MKVETYKCDGCGALKREVNHWWKLRVVGETYKVLTIFPASADQLPCDDDAADFCGTACLLKKISELLGSGRDLMAQMGESK